MTATGARPETRLRPDLPKLGLREKDLPFYRGPRDGGHKDD
ncbi:hypothetical protein [Tropicibacter oceani]|uniref:Uncharacterized protein n=1 Tax=Tropicibacter oceani TaxID=3058420 RepID=A0ABY8QH54_9RHOB|nr:hypothetical protein [Tropicibacter oceani]WGW03865.1 hypothetical protein QF118_18415 [Tropicibacter oceani]